MKIRKIEAKDGAPIARGAVEGLDNPPRDGVEAKAVEWPQGRGGRVSGRLRSDREFDESEWRDHDQEN